MLWIKSMQQAHESTEPSLNVVCGFDDLPPKLKITEGVSKI
jgi:hypothetical protein